MQPVFPVNFIHDGPKVSKQGVAYGTKRFVAKSKVVLHLVLVRQLVDPLQDGVVPPHGLGECFRRAGLVVGQDVGVETLLEHYPFVACSAFNPGSAEDGPRNAEATLAKATQTCKRKLTP